MDRPPTWTVRLAGIGLIVALAAAVTSARGDSAANPSFVPPGPPDHPEVLGAGIGRTMHLLASSTPDHRNTVRILFYGQSITEQPWWRQVDADLRRRFPHADLRVENRAIGGFSSERLIKPAEHDIFAFYPDLVIFHVYGSHHQYEEIIRSIRSRTTAEVLMQTDHLRKWPPEPVSRWGDRGAWWDDQMNRVILPGIAAKYGCGLVDVRSEWTRYLKANRLEPAALLQDEIHLNAAGCDLMAALVGRYLVAQPGGATPTAAAPVQDVPVGRTVAWQGGRLTLPFRGNRIDLIAGASGGEPGRSLDVRIDGRRPAEFPELYASTRPTPKPWSDLSLIRVDHDRPLVAEDWTLVVDSYSAEPPAWTFHVVGTATGPDGVGDSGAPFVSKSGRVRIEPDSWFRTKPVAPGYEIRWSVQSQFVATYAPAPAADPTIEPATTLFQGLTNGAHTLELVAGPGGPPPVAALRIYRPPYVAPPTTLIVAGSTTGVILILAVAWWAGRRGTLGEPTRRLLARPLPRLGRPTRARNPEPA